MSDRRDQLPVDQPPVEQPPAAEVEEQIPDYPLVREDSAPPPALGGRLRDPRTIVSLAVPIIVIILVLVAFPSFHFDQLPSLIAQANPWLLLAAFLVYYLGFPLRGWRWAILLRNAGAPIRVRDSTEIIFISWLVNCLVPAKLGDVYRAYLVKVTNGTSASLAFGTIFIERVFDLFAIVLLGLAAGFWSFRSGMSPEVQLILAIGLVVIGLLAVGLFLVRNFGSRIVRRLPLPHRVVEFYDRFEEGLFSIKARSVPLLAILTATVWMTEALRLYFVVLAMGFGLQMGISGGLFVALIASLLTAIPFTPAGLGAVEGAVVVILTSLYGATPTQAVAIVLVDRTISVLSIIVFGGITYIVSDKTKGARPAATTAETTAS